eukprot:COSAG05_NODE_4325_length_1567_cov_1.333106_2_plen_55_part_00
MRCTVQAMVKTLTGLGLHDTTAVDIDYAHLKPRERHVSNARIENAGKISVMHGF